MDFPVGDRVDASVDVGSGNLLVTTTDLTLPGISGDVQFGLDFNSLLLGPDSPLPSGAAGPGWATRLGHDTKLVSNTDGSVLYLAPGGLEGRYVPTGGGNYTTPAGFKNTLTKTGTTWSLRDHQPNAISTFNSAGKLTTITDRNGQATTLTYGGGGYLATITSTRGGANASKLTATIDSIGRLAKVTQVSNTGSTSRSVRYGYSYSSQVTSLTDTAGRVTTFGYASIGGDLTSITNPAGVTTTFTYDANHRVTAVNRDSTGIAALTRLSYPSGTQTLVAGPNTNPTQPVTSVSHTSYTLDGTDRVTTAVDPLGRTRSTSYTPLTDIASSTSPEGGVTTAAHGTNGGESLTGLTAPTGATMSLDYGTGTGPGQYLPTGGTDAQGNASVFSYDGVGNPLSTANSQTAATAAVTYHGDGTLATSTDPAGKTTSYSHNATTHQVNGITPPAGSGIGATTLAYDGYGRLTRVTNGVGVATIYTYDDLDRVTKVAYSDYTHAVTYDYDDAGNLAVRDDATGTTSYGHDGLDRLTTRAATSGGGTLTYGYDAAGNMTTSTNGHGTTHYVYDDANQLVSSSPPGGAQSFNLYGYDDDGNRTDTWWRTNATHTTFAAHTHTDFDASGRVARTWTSRASNDTTRVFDTSYCHAPYVAGQSCPTTTSNSTDTGLVQWSTDQLTGARSLYSYDGANRLVEVTGYHGHHYQYGYDVNGNRTTAKVDGSTVQSLSFNAGNQITSTGFSYDTAGRLTHDPDAGTISYNGAGQMTAASTSTYTYAGVGQAESVTRTGPGSSTFTSVYGTTTPQGVPVLDSLTKNANTYYFDNDPTTGQPQAFHQPNTQADYLVTDGQGSIVAIVSGDAGGTLIGTYTYDPYGVQTGQTGTAFAMTINPYRHTSGLLDPATGWVRHGTRYHDTTTGRWTTTDPITRLADPDNANPYTYTYVADDPINNTDPTGRDTGEAIAAGICGVASLAFGLIAPPVAIEVFSSGMAHVA